MKRSCKNCKAFILYPKLTRCSLGYKIDEKGEFSKPLEQCEKPLTWGRLYELELEKKKNIKKATKETMKLAKIQKEKGIYNDY